MRGKHSTATQAALRAELGAATAELQRVQTRLAAAERQVRELTEWKQNATRDGLPDLRAERQRNTDQALRHTVELDDARRDRQRDCDELAEMIGLPETLTADEWVRYSRLVSPAVRERMAIGEASRQTRRDVARMPPWVQSKFRVATQVAAGASAAADVGDGPA